MLAFALIAPVMAVLIVGSVISGAVVARYQRIGVLKSFGLTPAPVAAAMAAPAAVALNDATVSAMGAAARTGIPAGCTEVFGPARLALLSLAAVAIAVAGALLPAACAARTRPATARRGE